MGGRHMDPKYTAQTRDDGSVQLVQKEPVYNRQQRRAQASAQKRVIRKTLKLIKADRDEGKY